MRKNNTTVTGGFNRIEHNKQVLQYRLENKIQSIKSKISSHNNGFGDASTILLLELLKAEQDLKNLKGDL